MTDFNRFPMNRKPHSYNTLKRMTKGTLIEYIMCLEHNYENLYLAYNAAVDANIERFKDFKKVILCSSCKHWTQSTGKMTGYGLGRCDFHDADLVTCNGFCYWAERKEE